MDFNDYQIHARKTANEDNEALLRMVNWALGAAGEAGEVADNVKKIYFHDHEMDKEELKKELGDVLWYLANLAYEMDIRFEEVAIENIQKLAERYPEGFSEFASKNRKEYKSDIKNPVGMPYPNG